MSHHHHHHHHSSGHRHSHKHYSDYESKPEEDSNPIRIPSASDFLVPNAKFRYPDLVNLLLNTSATAVASAHNGEVITIKDSETVAHCLDVLSKNNISSAPVINVHQNPPRIIGMVDYADIVEFAVQVIEDTRKLGPVTDYQTILEQSERFITTKVIDIMDSSRIDPLQPVMGKEPLAKVIELLGLRGLHRIVVLNDQHMLDGVITQSAVISFFATHHQVLGSLLNHTVEALMIPDLPVISARLNESALSAFKRLRLNKVSALAVVNTVGELVGNISLRDLRLIAPEVSILPRLYLSVSEFLSRVRRETTAPQHAVVCTKDDTFLTVLQKICANRVHRVWIVDSTNKRPIGVVSLRDVLWYIFVRATETIGADDMDTS